ncbi:MAG: hypothetical protein CME07_03100 [Gemmatimonadetes bacterium]|nr:hypothetical protein [Gemmatimonadota bacterium]
MLIEAGGRHGHAAGPGARRVPYLRALRGLPPWRTPEEAGELRASVETGLGGTTLVWDGFAQRLAPDDFRSRTLFGRFADWPIAASDLAPYYDDAEREIGLAGGPSGGLPAHPLAEADERFAAAITKLGGRAVALPNARASRPYRDRPACGGYAGCAACPTLAKYTAESHIVRALSTGRLELRTRDRVTSIETGDGRIDFLRTHDVSGNRRKVQADAFVLAAGSLVNASLLRALAVEENASPPPAIPWADHLLFEMEAFLDEAWMPGTTAFPVAGTDLFASRKERERGGAIGMVFGGTAATPAAGRIVGELFREDGRTGRDLAKGIRRHLRGRVAITVCVEPPQDAGRSLRPGTEAGALPELSGEWNDAARKAVRRGEDAARRVFRAMGAKRVRRAGSPRLAGSHTATAPMTASSAEVPFQTVGTDLRVPGAENLFAVSAGVLPSPGSVRPALTVAALALRVAKAVR